MQNISDVSAHNADFLLSADIDTIFGAEEHPSGLELPLYIHHVSAGFPSPASDYIEQNLDLNAWLVTHPASTFFLRVSGDSMINAGIFQGDYLVVDRSPHAQHRDIVIAVIDGELTVKRLFQQPPLIELWAENEAYPPIKIQGEMECLIWGVVTSVIRKKP